MMSTDRNIQPKPDRLVELEQAYSKALKALKVAEQECGAADRKRDRLRGKAESVKEEIAMERLKGMNGKPDLRALLDDSGDSQVFYEALVRLAESVGFNVFGKRADTKQTGLHFSMNRAEIGAVERRAHAIRYFAQAMRRKSGRVFFGVSTTHENCAWELRWHVDSGHAVVAQMTYGSDFKTYDFNTLEAALQWIEANLWVENVVDQAEDVGLIGAAN
ncbi:hypothetical protein ACMHYO_11730 [Allopusillimonas ginsengisoli]|uniref:hypothetical protein n=1 Tax=Allopusillimonas ginsengisoli TaxID=453575 RepID=UPI0039C4558F